MIYYRKTLFGRGPKLTAVQGQKQPSITTIQKLAVVLEISMSKLFQQVEKDL